MYCPTCMVEVPTTHKHSKKKGQDTLEIFCPQGHFVTRLIPDKFSEIGWKLDPDAYQTKETEFGKQKSVK